MPPANPSSTAFPTVFRFLLPLLFCSQGRCGQYPTRSRGAWGRSWCTAQGSRGRTLATSREHPPPSRLRYALAAIGPPPQRRTGSSPAPIPVTAIFGDGQSSATLKTPRPRTEPRTTTPATTLATPNGKPHKTTRHTSSADTSRAHSRMWTKLGMRAGFFGDWLWKKLWTAFNSQARRVCPKSYQLNYRFVIPNRRLGKSGFTQNSQW